MTYPAGSQYRISQKGFSLIELIVVIALIAVTSIAGFISFSSLAGDRLIADTRTLINDFCWARQLSISQHQDFIIDFSSSTRYTIYRGSIAASNAIKEARLTASISSPTSPFTVTFYRFNNAPIRTGGSAYSASSVSNILTIVLLYSGKSRTVQVFENTGYVRLQ